MKNPDTTPDDPAQASTEFLSLTFSRAEIAVVSEALQMVRYYASDADSDTFQHVEQVFVFPRYGQDVNLDGRHVRVLINTVTYLYGFAASGAAVFRTRGGEDKSAFLAERASALLSRLYAWVGADPADLHATMERARDNALAAVHNLHSHPASGAVSVRAQA